MKKTPPSSSEGRRARTLLAAVAALAASATLLTACGGDKPGAGAPAPKSPSAAAGTPSPKAAPASYKLTSDAHVAPGQDVGGRYRLARLLGTSGMDICVDSLLGPTPRYGDDAQAAHKNQAMYQTASDKVWATLGRGTGNIHVYDDRHYLQFLKDPSQADSGVGAVGCQIDLRTDVTAFHRDERTRVRTSEGVQEIACLSTVTASTEPADQLMKEDPDFFGRTPDGHKATGTKPTRTVHAGGLNFYLVSGCTSGDIPPGDFGSDHYDRAGTDNAAVGRNLLQAMSRHLAP